MSQAGDGAPALVLANIKAPKNGYAYIYVSNESDEMVYFDNLQVAQSHGRILEENHYYAYGLRIAALSSRKLADSREGHAGNFNLYNDKELFEEADLGWYDYGFRHYDPQIGRFPQLDPLTDAYPYYTPYQYAGCEPIANIDVDGLEPFGAIKWGTTFHQVLEPVTVTYKAANVGKSIVTSVVSMASKALDFAGKQLTTENLSTAADLVTDFIPFVSGGKEIYKGITNGNGWQILAGVGFIVTDIATAGTGSLVIGSIKTGGKALLKYEIKQAAKAAAKEGTTAFRSFTSGNFRTNLGRLTGNIPANSQAHHVFPQAKEFSSFFSSKGINIHDPKFGSWWNSASHGKNAYQYNAQWRQWISNNPNATVNDVMNYGRQIMGQYGLPVHY